jgi:hypothetical protein
MRDSDPDPYQRGRGSPTLVLQILPLPIVSARNKKMDVSFIII